MRSIWSASLGLLFFGCSSQRLREPPTAAPLVAPPAEVSVSPAGTATTAEPARAGKTVGALVLDGTPEIPEALRERLGRYLETRTATLSALADDGRSLLVSTRFAQTAQTHWVRRPLGARMQLTFRAEPVSGASFVPGGTDAILFLGDAGGNEQYQIFRQDLKSGQTSLLTDGKSRHGGYVWSWAGDRIAYTSNARNGKDMDVYLGDGKSAPSGKLLLERSGQWSPLEWTRDGKRLLLMEYVSINDSRLYLADVATRQVTRVTPQAPVASYRAAALDPQAKRLYLTTDRDGEFIEAFEVDLEHPTAPWKPLTRHVRWNVEQLALSPDGGQLAYTTNEDGFSVLRLLDTRTRKDRVVQGVPPGIVSGLSFARKAPVLGFTLSSATTNGDTFSYDLRTRKLERWTESEVGGLPRDRFVEPKLVRFPSFDGRSIPAFLYSPAGPGPHPVVVWIHGGPEAQARPDFSALIQYLLVESGIAVAVPNVRGSDGYGKSYLLLDNGEKREDSVKDIGALLDWIGAQKQLDARRVAVLGGSYGGYMVLASLTHFPERLVAGVDIVGISNFVTFLEKTMPYRRDLRRAEYGDERDPEMRKLLLRISPTTNASKISSALFVAHGANDPRVPLAETDQIVAEVRKRRKDVWYMVAKNEGHGFQKKENRDTFSFLTALFLEQQLGARR